MAYIGESDMTDLSSTSGSSELGSPAGLQISSPQAQPMASALDLAHHLGQVSLDSSPVLAAKAAKFTRKYSLRELEIQQTIGELCCILLAVMQPYAQCCYGSSIGANQP